LSALRVHLHDAVVAVAHPARDIERACSTNGRFAKPDALHLTAHDRADCSRGQRAISHGNPSETRS
jgi:hypothetical protein